MLEKPKPIVVSTLPNRVATGTFDWVAKNFAVGSIAYFLAFNFNPYVTKYFIAEVPVLTEQQKKVMEDERKKLLDTINRIEKRQAEIGQGISPDADRETQRAIGALPELLRRNLGLEKDTAGSVNVLRARLQTLHLQDGFYSTMERLSFWLTFVIAVYYLTEPIEALIAGRRRKIKEQKLANQITVADGILTENDIKLESQITKIKRQMTETLATISTMLGKYLNSELKDNKEFEKDMSQLQEQVTALLGQASELEGDGNETKAE